MLSRFRAKAIQFLGAMRTWRLPADMQPDALDTYRPLVVAVHLAALLAACLIVFPNNHVQLFFGYDGLYHRVATNLQHHWTTREPWATNSPFQGLGDMFFPANTRYSLGYSGGAVIGGGEVNVVATYTIVAFEAFLGILFMAWSFRFRPAVGFLAAWLITLLAMPFVHPYIFYPISRIAPNTIEFLAAQSVMLALFYRVGQHSRWVSAGLVVAMIGLSLWCFIYSLAFVLLMAPMLVVFFAASFFSAETREERWTKAIGMLVLIAALLPTAAPYFVGNYLYSVPTFFSRELENDRMNRIFVSVFFHWHFTGGLGWFGPFLVVGSVVGASIACFAETPIVRNLARGFLGAAVLLFVTGLALTYCWPNYRGPSPLYLEIFLWPFHGVMFAFLIFSAVRCLGRGLSAIGAIKEHVAPIYAVTRLQQSYLVLLVFPIAACIWSYQDGSTSVPQYHYAPGDTPLVHTLIEKVSVHDNHEFRGIVATFTGYHKSPNGVGWHNICSADMIGAANVENDFRAMGLWHYEIPTLFEYSQFMTPSYYFMMTRMLARPQDRQMRSVIVLTKPNIAYLRSLGVRFIVTDHAIAEADAALVQSETIEALTGTTMYLYELRDPNLATFSPVEIVVIPDAKQTVERLQRHDFDFATQAVSAAELPGGLVKASASHLEYCQGGMVINARSSGTSVLLLPLQYSHCLELKFIESDTHGEEPRLVRLNVMQTGLVFSGSIRAEIRFANGPFRNQFGRLQDYREFKALMAP